MSFDLLSRGNMQREKTRRAKIPLVFFSDSTASSDSDEVLSAGDMGYNLFLSNTAVSEDLSNKSAKSTHHSHSPPPPFFFFCDYFHWIQSWTKEVVHISKSAESLATWPSTGRSSYLLFFGQCIDEKSGLLKTKFLVLQPLWSPACLHRHFSFLCSAEMYLNITEIEIYEPY